MSNYSTRFDSFQTKYLDVQPNPEGRQKEGERCGYIFEMCEEGLHCVFPNNKPGRQWGIKTGTCRKSKLRSIN